MVLQRSPQQLLTAVPKVLSHLTTSFKKYALQINWNKGKTEGLLLLRGRRAHAMMQQYADDDGYVGNGDRLTPTMLVMMLMMTMLMMMAMLDYYNVFSPSIVAPLLSINPLILNQATNSSTYKVDVLCH